MSIFTDKKIISLFTFIMLIVTAFFVFRNSNHNKAEDTGNRNSQDRAPYYKDIVIEKIYLDNDDSIYSLKDGNVLKDGAVLDAEKDSAKIKRILSLAILYQWMKEDPLFFSADLDTEKAAKSVSLLKEKQAEFLKKYNWEYNFFAVNFLEKFTEASAGYKEFENKVSEENAKNLIGKIKSANKEYYNDADNLEKMILKLFSEELGTKGREIANLYGNSHTNSDIIVTDLEKIKDNSHIVQKEIGKREKCFLGSWKFCQRPAEIFSRPKTPAASGNSMPYLFPKEILELGGAGGYSGPYKIDSLCWKDGGDQYLYVFRDCPGYLDYCRKGFSFATDIYFTKLGKDILLPFEKYMHDQGAELLLKNPTTPYTCANMDYEPKITTMDYFYKNFKDKRFYKNLGGKENFKDYPKEFQELVKEGENAEDSFFDSQYPDGKNLEYLANFYGYTYNYLAKESIISLDEKEELLKRYVLLSEKLTDFDLLLNKTYYYFWDFAQGYLVNKFNPPEAYAYSIRSEYSLFFLNFDPFVWKSGAKLEYLIKDKEGSESEKEKSKSGIIDYESAVSLYGKENVLKWIKLTNENLVKKHEMSIMRR